MRNVFAWSNTINQLIGDDEMESPVVAPIAMDKKIGIDAIKESVSRMKEVFEAIAVVFEDGKVTVSDLKVLPEMIADIKDLIGAIKEAKDEVKDLDAEEMKLVVADLFDMVLYIAKKLGAQV